MTDELVFDTSPLSHFARARHLDALEKLTQGRRRSVTEAVRDELDRGAATFPELAEARDAEWLTVVRVDSLAELTAFAAYANLLGAGERDIGEAATLAYAEVHSAAAVIDERAGTRAGRLRGVEVHGTLWLVARGFRAGVLDEAEAEQLIDDLADTEMWFPCTGAEFFAWAGENELL